MQYRYWYRIAKTSTVCWVENKDCPFLPERVHVISKTNQASLDLSTKCPSRFGPLKSGPQPKFASKNGPPVHIR